MREYIGTIYTETGHDYIGPFSNLKDVITDAKSVADNWESEYESPVTAIYVSPFNAETSMPDSDADPLWMWKQEDVLEKPAKLVKNKRVGRARLPKQGTYTSLGGLR